MGISGNYNDVLLEALANRGNGTYHYVANADAAERFRRESAGGIFTETARDARIQVEFNPESVRKYRLIGYENRAVADADFRDDTLDFGEVGFARDVSALYELRLFDAAPGNAALATARLRWQDPQTREPVELASAITWGQTAADILDTSPYFRQATATAEFAELLRQSFWAQCSDLGAVTELLDTAVAELGENRSYRELRQLVKDAGEHFEPTQAVMPWTARPARCWSTRRQGRFAQAAGLMRRLRLVHTGPGRHRNAEETQVGAGISVRPELERPPGGDDQGIARRNSHRRHLRRVNIRRATPDRPGAAQHIPDLLHRAMPHRAGDRAGGQDYLNDAALGGAVLVVQQEVDGGTVGGGDGLGGAAGGGWDGWLGLVICHRQ